MGYYVYLREGTLGQDEKLSYTIGTSLSGGISDAHLHTAASKMGALFLFKLLF